MKAKKGTDENIHANENEPDEKYCARRRTDEKIVNEKLVRRKNELTKNEQTKFSETKI